MTNVFSKRTNLVLINFLIVKIGKTDFFILQKNDYLELLAKTE